MKAALHITLYSWVLLLIGIIIIGSVAHVLGNPILLIIFGIVIIALWSVIVYRIAKSLINVFSKSK